MKRTHLWNCRRISAYGVLLVVLFAFGLPHVHGASFEEFFPLLIQLPGWKAETPDGLKMETSGVRMLNAFREYTRGEQKATAAIVCGTEGGGLAAAGQSAMDMETGQMKMATKDIRGFRVTIVHDKGENSGAVTVALLNLEKGGANFVFSYEGISDIEGLELAQRFSWEDMLKKAQTLQ